MVAKEENPRAVLAHGRTDRMTGLSINWPYDKTQGEDKTKNGTALEVAILIVHKRRQTSGLMYIYGYGPRVKRSIVIN